MKERDAHETYRVAARRLHWYALGLLGTLFVLVLAMYWLARPLMEEVAAIPSPTPPPAPRLQPNPAVDLAAVRQRETEKLRNYEWVDRSAGVARIPIERAMQLLVQVSASQQSAGAAAAPSAARAATPAAGAPR